MYVAVCSSFQCLRLSNFFNRPDLVQIQAMGLIGHCLRNNLDTNSAWILMGERPHKPLSSLPQLA